MRARVWSPSPLQDKTAFRKMRRMLGFFKHKNLNIYTNQIQQGPLSQKNSIHTGAQPGRTIFP